MKLKNVFRDKCLFFACLVMVCCLVMAMPVMSAVTLDGTVHSNTADDVNNITISHTTGTDDNRLMLVGVSWNCGTTDRTISSVTFTPSGGGAALNLTHVITQLGYNTTNPRYSAIYSLVNPPSGQAGTVTVTFSGSVSNGIMAGVANFAGANQTTPLGTPSGTNGNSTAPSITLTGLNGDELVFDNVFLGASGSSYTLTVGSGQTQLWNPTYVANLRAAASTEQATSGSVTMNWTASTGNYWAIAAVPINPGADVTDPTVTIDQASGQNDPTSASPINFTVVFSESVSDFATGDVTLSGTAPGTLTGTVTGSGTTYNVAVSGMTGSGTVIASIAAGVAHDAADNPNEASTSTDNTVTYNHDTTAPTVTINKAAGQADPTNTAPVNFTVVFSETVTDFATGDVNLSSSTTGGSLIGTVTGSGTTYNVAVSGMTGSGNVIASIDAGVAHDEAGNPNSASTSTDNTVGYVHVPPPSLDGDVSSGKGEPTTSSVTFSHTTGTGSNRLMLVGVSWNCGTTDRTISSITFTPDGGSATALTEVKTQQYHWTSGGTPSSGYRYTAIYSLLNPGSGVSGTVDITFSGAVSNGMIAGAANFAGVDQTTPLGTPDGAVGTGTSSSGTPNPSVTLTGLAGNELVFDSVFMGASSTSHTMTADAGQSELWNILGYTSGSSFNMRGAASTKQATAASVTMSWTTGGYGTTATRWAIAAVPIKPYGEPIDVELSACSARRIENGAVAIEWITQSEIKTAGFFVLRSEDQDFGFARLHDSIIKAIGSSASGASYQFIDLNSPKGICYYRLEEVSLDGQSTFYEPVAVSLASAVDNETQVPLTFALSQNYPNPFNPVTRIDYTLPQGDQVTLNIYDLNGRLVKQLVNERQKEGRYSVTWDGTNEQERHVVSGTYLYRLSAGENIAVHKMVLLK